ncbi:hypothetical protein [Cobetia amphilecti]|nr:hypothetical protein [Cobetia amphilecti]
MIASYGFFGLIISQHTRKIIIIGFFAAFIFSLYLLYTWLGRMGFLLYLFTFIFGFVLSKTTSLIKLLTLGALCFVLCLFSAYAVSNILSLKSSSSIISFIAREISFPFASFISQLENNNHLDRFLIDFIFTPIYLLPSSWWSSWFTQVGEINTEVIMGAAKGVDGVTGAIPVDILTLGLMQGHFPGVIITGIIFGILLRYLQFKVFSVNILGLRYMLEAYLILKISLFSLFYAQPNMVIIGNFPLIASVLLCSFFLFAKERVKFL